MLTGSNSTIIVLYLLDFDTKTQVFNFQHKARRGVETGGVRAAIIADQTRGGHGSAAHHTGRTILPCYSPAEQTKHRRKHYFEGRSLEFKDIIFL